MAGAFSNSFNATVAYLNNLFNQVVAELGRSKYHLNTRPASSTGKFTVQNKAYGKLEVSLIKDPGSYLKPNGLLYTPPKGAQIKIAAKKTKSKAKPPVAQSVSNNNKNLTAIVTDFLRCEMKNSNYHVSIDPAKNKVQVGMKHKYFGGLELELDKMSNYSLKPFLLKYHDPFNILHIHYF